MRTEPRERAGGLRLWVRPAEGAGEAGGARQAALRRKEGLRDSCKLLRLRPTQGLWANTFETGHNTSRSRKSQSTRKALRPLVIKTYLFPKLN